MVPPLKRSKGFTLIEVLFAAALIGATTVVLINYFIHNQQTRVQVEGKRQAALAADYRCQLFSSGILFPDVFYGSPQEGIPTEANPPDLPGGFPVRTLREKISLNADRSVATIEVTYVVETAKASGATATALGIRVR